MGDAGSRLNTPGALVLVIVARDQRALFDYMKWGFARVRAVKVIRDRRFGSRRDGGQNPAPRADRRGPDRRRHSRLQAELMARGFVITRWQ